MQIWKDVDWFRFWIIEIRSLYNIEIRETTTTSGTKHPSKIGGLMIVEFLIFA